MILLDCANLICCKISEVNHENIDYVVNLKLINSYFDFNDTYYLQIYGLPMGGPCSTPRKKFYSKIYYLELAKSAQNETTVNFPNEIRNFTICKCEFYHI